MITVQPYNEVGDEIGPARYIRPTPFISISQNAISNKLTKFGSTYDITLTGAVTTRGTDTITTDLSETRTFSGDRELASRLPDILYRQNEIREYFSHPFVFIEVLDINADQRIIGFYAEVQSINFEEGIYVDIARYTISLTAQYLLDQNNNVHTDGTDIYSGSGRQSLQNIIESQGGMIEDLTDNWSIEPDESFGQYNTATFEFHPRVYRVSRNITATGKKIPFIRGEGQQKAAWEHARDFIKMNVDFQRNTYNPQYEVLGYNGILSDSPYIFTEGTSQIPSTYNWYNHSRSESFDKGNGSYSITDTWLLASGDYAVETYNLSINSTTDDSYISVSIDGTIKGLSPSESQSYPNQLEVSPFDSAQAKYNQLSNNGQFGLASIIYKRANNSVAQYLNTQPKSIALGLNETAGEITYNLQFDNRPTNYFSGILSENITVNDTYPGDVFAIIPVIGRATGPVLQYIGGRTEYRRDVSIEVRLDYTDIGYNNDRHSFMLTKPSLNEPFRTQLNDLIYGLSPASEVGVRKYFLNAPSESWSPKDGAYSLNLSWVYELDR